MSDNLLDYIPALRAYARSLCGNAPDADDLVQETLLRATEHVASYRAGTNMRAWLFTIMRNRFYTSIGKQRREMTGGADCVSSIPVTTGGQEWHMRGRELAEALAALPVHYREAIVLVVVLGERYDEVARLLGCEMGTVKSRVNRARRMIQARIGASV